MILCYNVPVLLILTSQRIGESSAKNDITQQLRGAAPSIVEWIILCYVGGEPKNLVR